jgi:hypothetical protein
MGDTALRPFKLAGARERVDQISQSSISEPPEIDVRALECPNDPSRGYLVVVVPQSPRAPHQVIVRGEMRYYGRGATGNRRLTEGEIARLYTRRESWEIDREALLDRELQYWSDRAREHDLGFLYAFARPVVADLDLLEQAAEATSVEEILAALLAAGKKAALPIEPGLRQSPLSWFLSGGEGWELRQEERRSSPKHELQIDVERSGHCHLFCGRAAELFVVDLTERRIIFESTILGCLASLLALAGELYSRAGYVGAVDIGVWIIGLKDGFSETLYGRALFWEHGYARDEFRRTKRVTAQDLVERPKELGLDLTRNLTEATVGAGYDPWA